MSSYESQIREVAKANAWEAFEEGEGLRVTDPLRPSFSCWHRLGGYAEEQHDSRQDSDIPRGEGMWSGNRDNQIVWRRVRER